MPLPSRMPHYDVRNDGVGPYVVFYCDQCEREYRSQPNIGNTISSGIGTDIKSDLLRKIPLFGGVIANNVERNDPRYTSDLNAQQIIEQTRAQLSIGIKKKKTQPSPEKSRPKSGSPKNRKSSS